MKSRILINIKVRNRIRFCIEEKSRIRIRFAAYKICILKGGEDEGMEGLRTESYSTVQLTG